MKSLEYLHGYADFDPVIVQAIGETAAWQDQKTFEELAALYRVDENLRTVQPKHSKNPIEILTFVPRDDFDESAMRVYHLPMGCSLDENMIMNGMRLFGSDPSQRLMLVGNPSSPGHDMGKITAKEAFGSYWNHDLKAFVEPLLEHLYDSNITDTAHLGYSYGANKAVTATVHSQQYDQYVDKGVYAEPAAVVSLGLIRLPARFAWTNRKVKGYIKQAESAPYSQIRGKDNLGSLASYIVGLMRLSNIAIASNLAHEHFEEATIEALDSQPTEMTIAWGSKSELAPDVPMQFLTGRLIASYGKRVQALRLKGMHHAGANDINLHAAIMLQGLGVGKKPGTITD